MASHHTRTLLSTLIVSALAGAMQPAWAVLPISQQPLILPTKVKPAFIMSLDNSGSIGSDETLCRTNQGGCYWSNSTNSFWDNTGTALESGTSYVRVMRPGDMPQLDKYGGGRDPEFNRAYFNPSSSFTPWVNFDSSPYLGSNADGSTIANFVDQTTGNAVITSAAEDPRHPKTATNGGGGTTFNFTTASSTTYTVAAAGSGKMDVGDIIPAGDSVEYSTNTALLNCAALKTVLTTPTTPANNTMVKLAANFTIPASCNGGKITFQYYMATVYLTTNTAAGPEAVPGFNYANVITVPGAGPAGVNLYKYEIIPGNFAVAADYQAAVQNFANYWSYYADRARAIVAAATQAFEGVDFMRVGNFWISPMCSGIGSCSPVDNFSKYLPGPDSSYSSAPAGDPEVPMFDMADYTYKTGVTINPIPPGGATFSATGGDRYQFYQSIYLFDRPNNNTPTRRAVYRMGHQFQRGPLTSGVSDTNPPIINACQANAGMLFTDGYINDDNGGLPAVGNVDGGGVTNANSAPVGVTHYGQAPFKDTFSNTMSDIAAWYFQQNLRPDLVAGQVPIASGCPAINLDCNPNLHMNYFGIPLGARGQYYDISPYINLPNTSIDEATVAAYTTPPAWAASGTVNLQPSDVDDIWHATINSHGGFISAQSPAAVRDGIRQVIDSLLSKSLNSGSLPVLGVRLGVGSLTYTPSFTVSGTDWFGNLAANLILSDGSAGPQQWDAGLLLKSKSNAALDNLKVFINTSAGTTAGHVTAAFDQTQVGTLGGTESAQLSFLGLNPATFHGVYGASLSTPDVVNFLKGDHTNELANGGTFRTRSAVLGDIIDSEPQISDAHDDFGFSQSLPASVGGGTGGNYDAFLTAKQSRIPRTMVYVGANDGMLHAFDGTPGGGTQEFAFIPNSVANKLGLLINPDYVHNFYVDGAQTVFDAEIGVGATPPWQTVLVGSTGAGGSGVYALNVTSPASFQTTSPMWEVTSTTDPDIGANVGTPLVIIAQDSKSSGAAHWYAVFGNGYNSTNSNPALIVVDMTSGAIVKKLVANDGGAFDNGIGQIAAIDSDGDGFVDAVYGGDYRGNMWKFDLSGASPAAWNVAFAGKPLYTALDGSGNPQPITGGIDIAPGPLGGSMIYFGTGSFFLTSDNTAASPAPVQSLYGIWDNGTADLTGRASLVSQQIQTNNVTNPPTRTTTNLPVTYTAVPATTQRGFFMDLVVSGLASDSEKFFGFPRVQNDIVFYTTFEPSGDSCGPDGKRWLYGLNAITGANALSQLDIGKVGGASACPAGGCGAVELGTGAPVKDTTIVIPPAACVPFLDPTCPIPAKGSPPIPDSTLYSACEIIVRAEGSLPYALPRPCGRQSWRQVR